MAEKDPQEEVEETVVEAPEAPEVEEAPEAETPEQPEAKAPKAAKASKAAKDAPAAEDAPATEPKSAAKQQAAHGERPVVRAQAKYVRSSARKARLVCDHIRGKSVTEARAILALTPRAVAEDWEKLLNSAVANAEHNHDLVGEDLRIASITADEGPTLKRFRPRAMGRASRIRKRTSHLTITLTPKE